MITTKSSGPRRYASKASMLVLIALGVCFSNAVKLTPTTNLVQLSAQGGLSLFGGEAVAEEQVAAADEEDPTAGLTPEQVAEAQAQAEAQA